MFSLVFSLQILSCFLMTGVIWVIQLVHYPSFSRIEPSQFVEFISFHGLRISFIVVPLMVLELATAVALWLMIPKNEASLALVSLATLALIWVFTFFVSARVHGHLGSGFDLLQIQSLVKGNWVRTALWSLRSVILFFLLIQFLQRGLNDAISS